jgi:capsular exopolysaccharide synthesis family protein
MMEMDLRKPRLTPALHIDHKPGFSDYVVSDMKPADIIRPSGLHPNCFIITSGSIPPNPAELIVNDKVPKLFEALRGEFDYIIIDTPAIGLVSDALLFSQYTDAVLYIIRQRTTYKKQVNIVQGLVNEKRFKKVDIIFNDIKPIPGYGYGYKRKYGSGYYDDYKRPFWKRIFGIGKRNRTSEA